MSTCTYIDCYDNLLFAIRFIFYVKYMMRIKPELHAICFLDILTFTRENCANKDLHICFAKYFYVVEKCFDIVQ